MQNIHSQVRDCCFFVFDQSSYKASRLAGTSFCTTFKAADLIQNLHSDAAMKVPPPIGRYNH